jgi:hypothetical protein
LIARSDCLDRSHSACILAGAAGRLRTAVERKLRRVTAQLTKTPAIRW